MGENKTIKKSKKIEKRKKEIKKNKANWSKLKFKKKLFGKRKPYSLLSLNGLNSLLNSLLNRDPQNK